MNTPLIYKERPVFGIDIGFSSLKTMQITHNKGAMEVLGYGVQRFNEKAVENGIIVDPEEIAKAAKKLFEEELIGDITSRRVVATVPVALTYNRTMLLPKLSKKELRTAILGEAEQYIPLSIDELYIDFDIISETETEYEILMVAAPRNMIDSYMLLFDMLGLEVAAIETTIAASSRLVAHAERGDIPTILIDFGSMSSDITIYDKAMVVTGTVAGGSDTFTSELARSLGVTKQVAHTIKTKYGLGVSKKQDEVLATLKPQLDILIKEIKKMIRYYQDRTNAKEKIGQVITMGGGANMPGLSEYITSELRIPTRMCSPWENISFGKLQPPNDIEKSMYITVAGLALASRKELQE